MLHWVFRTKMYAKATLCESCPELAYLEHVFSGRKRKCFCCWQRIGVLILTQWPSSFPGSLKALERWVTCSSSVTLPFCPQKQAGSAPLASRPAGIELKGLIRIAVPIYAIDNVVRWRHVLFFFSSQVLRQRKSLTETKMMNVFISF